jgi:hypothetical protein
MVKIGVLLIVLLAGVFGVLGALGPSGAGLAGRDTAGQPAWLRAAVAVAATVPTAVNGVIDETQPSPTPSVTSSAVAAPLVRTVQIGAYNDAPVVSGGLWPPDTNLGGSSRLTMGPRSGGVFRSYLRFLVAGLPIGMQIDSALLVLTPIEGGAHAVPIEADFVQDDWSESTINWNQQPLSTFRTGAASWRPGSAATVNIDVTGATQQWYACGGTSNNGLLLSADFASDWVDFGSRKSDAPPVLQVTYQRATAPVNCAAPPTSNVSLTPPQGISSSTTGAQIGGSDPNTTNNPNLLASGTPYGALSIPRSSTISGPATTIAGNFLPPLPYSTPPLFGPPAIGSGQSSGGGGGGGSGTSAAPVP